MEDKLKKLTPIQFEVTQNNGTELPFENEYWNFFEDGIYVDILTGHPLFSSTHKFESLCGWPSFFKSIDDKEILKKEDLSFGMNRVEVKSVSSNSHLGHIFTDGPLPTGVRFCINSAALEFVPKAKLGEFGLAKYAPLFDTKENNLNTKPAQFEKAYLGAGCFWGVEAIFSKIEGVSDVVSGYTGGSLLNPTYEDICTGTTGHAEVVEITFDKNVLSFEQILNYFWRLHDPTTLNRQGYDSGTQYRSVIYYTNDAQKEIALKSKLALSESGKWANPIVTEISLLEEPFYKAEEYHQDYYDKKYQGKPGPICHFLRDE